MAIKKILVHIDNSTASAARLDLAVQFAIRHNAHLQGIYVIIHPYYQPQHISENSDVSRVSQLFHEKTSGKGISADLLSLNWTITGVSITEIVTIQSYYSDLIIVGQTNYSSSDRSIPSDFPERLVLSSGRPVLVVPYAGRFTSAGDRIMVAWKAGRESTRAINDALPCLEKAKHVSIVGVSSGSNTTTSGDHFPELSAHLGYHGISPTSEIVSSGDLPVGDMLLNLACEGKIDMLVMGAYAHTRRGTLELGIVARHIFKHMTIPVLMSH